MRRLLPALTVMFVSRALAAPPGETAARLRSLLQEVTDRGWHQGVTLGVGEEADARRIARELEELDAGALAPEDRTDRELAKFLVRGRLESLEILDGAHRSAAAWLPSNRDLDAALVLANKNIEALSPFLERLEIAAFAAKDSLAEISRDEARTSAEAVSQVLKRLDDRWALATPGATAPLPETRALLEFLNKSAKSGHKRTAAERRQRTWDAYVQRFRWDVGVDDTPEDILKLGEEEFRKTEAALEAVAKKIDLEKSWREIAEELRADHPTAEGLLEECRKELAASTAFAREGRFISVPEWALNIRAEWGNPATNTPYGFYEPIDPADPQLRGTYVVTPVSKLKESAREEVLKGNNRAWIRVVALHEGIPGHHLQFAISARRTRPIRCGAYNAAYVEGWGLYCEELFARHGYYDDRTRLSQLKMRLWRCARAVIDVGCQFGGMSKEEAVDLLVDRVGIERPSAEMEVARYLAAPGYYSGYLVGCTHIEALRAAIEARDGKKFDERAFHDRFLSFGPLPFRVIEDAMLR